MGLTTIEWTSFPRPDGTFMPGYTANLWWGCTAVHEGCLNCYAETLSKRWGNDIWGNDKPRKEIKSVWDNLAKFQKLAAKAGEVHWVFVGSMMDIFEKPMRLIDSKGNPCENDTGFIRDLFFNVVVPASPNLMFLFLTKRPSNINKYIPESWINNPPANVMFGTSPVNQETANKLIPQLFQVNGKRFLSIEPQLGPINLNLFALRYAVHNVGNGYRLDWIIQGGESGHHRRPFNLQWAYDLKKECAETDTPYFFKQVDKVQPIPEDLLIRQFPKI